MGPSVMLCVIRDPGRCYVHFNCWSGPSPNLLSRRINVCGSLYTGRLHDCLYVQLSVWCWCVALVLDRTKGPRSSYTGLASIRVGAVRIGTAGMLTAQLRGQEQNVSFRRPVVSPENNARSSPAQ